ncbi:MAG: MFS transporter [Thermoleophilaceae bacterium]
MDRASLKALRAQPGYVRFLLAATPARVADEMFSVAVVLLVLERTGDAALAGGVVAAITLPSLITAPLLGAWMDLRGKRRRLMLIDQALATAVLIALVLMIGHAAVPLVILVVLCAGVTWPLSYGGFTSLIPTIVPDRLLIPANAIETTTLNVALILGPALAGIVSAVWSPAAALLVEAALTFVAGILIFRLPGIDGGPRRQADSLLRVAGDGLRLLVAQPVLRGVSLAGGLGLLGIGFLTVAFPFFCSDVLGVDRSNAGNLWAAFALGSTVGALGLVRLQRRWASERIVLWALAIFGVLMLSWPLAHSLAVALVLVSVASIADGPGLSATFAVRQQTVPRDLQGQVFTTAAGIKVGMFALGSGLAGAIVTGLGARPAIVIAAGIQVLAAAAGFVAMRGRRDGAPEAAPSAGRPSAALRARGDRPPRGSPRTREPGAPDRAGGRRA